MPFWGDGQRAHDDRLLPAPAEAAGQLLAIPVGDGKGGERGGMFSFRRGRERIARYGAQRLLEAMGEPRGAFIDTNCLRG